MTGPTESFAAIGTALTEQLGRPVAAQPRDRVGGGCISETWRWEADGRSLLVKLAPLHRLGMFEAEKAGLEELASAQAVSVPQALAIGATPDSAYLALEWIDFVQSTPQSESALGEQLAWQHRTQSREHGWHRDNTIGRTPQQNAALNDWCAFFRERRLRPQLDLAAANGYRASLQERASRLLESMDAFFTSHRPVPSLLHGDLWGGNWGTDAQGCPVIFDPAVYYGDRETDLAMTKLFGGFSNRFYTAYHSAWPLDQAAGARRPLYNLYHVLNHLNLFGGSYLSQAEDMINRLLAEFGH